MNVKDLNEQRKKNLLLLSLRLHNICHLSFVVHLDGWLVGWPSMANSRFITNILPGICFHE
ncbi:hypothetical protein DERF_002876 [Dermatophagoides farinae]|uniref:Uncharacterized protein n=1 Tax=Dermatophagoides farinae TaxID=6954 RepID=A0A922IEI1_DERFA|nr:hypothetical protein DERF_002876 [Dermatophagoides farinae]